MIAIIDNMKILLSQIMYNKNISMRQLPIMTGTLKYTIKHIIDKNFNAYDNKDEPLKMRMRRRWCFILS